MTTTELHEPRTINAQIHPGAIRSVADFFNASTRDVLNELFQNARRSGATRIDVTLNAPRLTVADNGTGIADPQLMLSFGDSGWQQDSVAAEHPAGMGFYALARRDGVSVTSRSTGRPGWQIELDQRHFRGELAAEVREAPLAHTPNHRAAHGTEVTFDSDEEISKQDYRHGRSLTAREEVELAALYCPLPVTLNGEPVRQIDFLQGAEYVRHHRGLRIGIGSTPRAAQLNFHGITVDDEGLRDEAVRTMDGHLYAQVDVLDAPALRLTLPARRELVEEEFTTEMRAACRRAAFEAIRARSEHTDLPKAEYDEALLLGIDLPEAQPRLKQWEPEDADWVQRVRYSRSRRELGGPEPLVVALRGEMPPCDQQVLARAADRAGLSVRLFEQQEEYEGYSWYDRLPKITTVETVLTTGGEEIRLDDLRRMLGRREELPEETTCPDTVTLRLTVQRTGEAPEQLELSSDIAMVNEEDRWNTNIVLVTTGCTMHPEELAEILKASYFSPSDDPSGDSYETQEGSAQDMYISNAWTVLGKGDEALLAELSTAADRYLRYRLPQHVSATLTLRRGEETRVEVHPDPEGHTDGGDSDTHAIASGEHGDTTC